MNFKHWLKNSDKKKVMVLIHPDCVIELDGQDEPYTNTDKYMDLLHKHLPKFDYVITHLFMPDAPSEFWNETKVKSYYDMHKTIKSLSHVAVSRNTYSCSYSQELPDYLMENPGSDIYMAGGYENFCLWTSYEKLFQKLGWLLKEQDHNVTFYKPLIFAQKYYGGLNRDKEYPVATYNNEYDTKKVKWTNKL